MQAQANNLRLCHKYHELEILCPIELMLIVKIIPFMFIVAQHKGVQRELKEKCIPVQADLIKKKKLPRSSNEEYLISLALKCRLSDKNAIYKKVIQPTTVKDALRKLKEINLFYRAAVINNQ